MTGGREDGRTGGRAVATVLGSGVVSVRDIQDINRRILGDPKFDPDFRVLANLIDVTKITMDSRAMAEAVALPRFNPDARRALVATGAAYAVASRFAENAKLKWPVSTRLLLMQGLQPHRKSVDSKSGAPSA